MRYLHSTRSKESIHLGDDEEDVGVLAVYLGLPLQLQQAVAPLHRLVTVEEQNSGGNKNM